MITFLALPQAASAAATFTFVVTEVGANVVATGTGSINLANLSYVETTYENYSSIVPDVAELAVGAYGSIAIYSGTISGPPSFGPGAETPLYLNITGPHFGLSASADYIYLPQGYISGTEMTDSATWDGATFASLGLTPGVYTYTYDDAGDSLVVDIEAASMPEPASLVLLDFGVAAFGTIRRYRANRSRKYVVAQS